MKRKLSWLLLSIPVVLILVGGFFIAGHAESNSADRWTWLKLFGLGGNKVQQEPAESQTRSIVLEEESVKLPATDRFFLQIENLHSHSSVKNLNDGRVFYRSNGRTHYMNFNGPVARLSLPMDVTQIIVQPNCISCGFTFHELSPNTEKLLILQIKPPEAFKVRATVADKNGNPLSAKVYCSISPSLPGGLPRELIESSPDKVSTRNATGIFAHSELCIGQVPVWIDQHTVTLIAPQMTGPSPVGYYFWQVPKGATVRLDIIFNQFHVTRTVEPGSETDIVIPIEVNPN